MPDRTDVEVALADARVQKCAAQHFGPWMVEPAWFERAVAAVKAGIYVTYRPRAAEGSESAERPAYRRTADGIAILSLEGQLTKGESSFGGGTSTVRVRRAIRQAAGDQAVKAIMLLIDSPGGTVAGTAELAADIAAANRTKPVHAHIEDLGASAAYWIGSQAARLTATPTSLVGSIGTVAVVEDSSGHMSKEGVVVHVICTGAYKGAFTPGAPVKPEHLEYLRGYVNDLNEHFLGGVATGRHLSLDAVRRLADGRIRLAGAAKGLGLLDAVCGQDEAMQDLRSRLSAAQTTALTKEKSDMWNPLQTGVPPHAASKVEPMPPVAEETRHDVEVVAEDLPAREPRAAIGAAPPQGAAAVDEPAREPPAEAPAPMPQSDRAAIEAQSAADARADLKKFMDAFGPAGAEWFAAGKTFDEARGLHAAALSAERDRLAEENADLKVRVAEAQGSPTPVSFSAPDAAAAAESDLAAKIGKNAARFAAGVRLPKNKEGA